MSCTETATRITVIEVIAAYLRFASGYYRKAGKITREYEMIVECCRLIKPFYARTPVIELGPLVLKTVRQKMIEADLSRNYINKNIERARRISSQRQGSRIIAASAWPLAPG